MSGGSLEKVMDLTLLLVYLTSWEEETRREPESIVTRAWRGYSFDILNKLEKEKLIRQYSNSIILTRAGFAKARELNEIYNRTGTTPPIGIDREKIVASKLSRIPSNTLIHVLEVPGEMKL